MPLVTMWAVVPLVLWLPKASIASGCSTLQNPCNPILRSVLSWHPNPMRRIPLQRGGSHITRGDSRCFRAVGFGCCGVCRGSPQHQYRVYMGTGFHWAVWDGLSPMCQSIGRPPAFWQSLSHPCTHCEVCMLTRSQGTAWGGRWGAQPYVIAPLHHPSLSHPHCSHTKPLPPAYAAPQGCAQRGVQSSAARCRHSSPGCRLHPAIQFSLFGHSVQQEGERWGG